MGRHNKKEVIRILISLALVIGLTFLVITTTKSDDDGADKKKCPFKIEGNISASLSIKYFESPYCPYCWLESPILKDLVEEKGSFFSLHRYDIRYCNEEASRYKVRGTPSFVFGIDGKEFPRYGYIDRANLYNIVCELSSSCK